MRVLLFFLFCASFCFAGDVPDNIVNGWQLTILDSPEDFPVSTPIDPDSEGFTRRNLGMIPGVMLQNYVNGVKEGSCIVFSDMGIFYTTTYKNGVVDGTLSIDPDSTHSVTMTVVNGVAEGRFEEVYQPFKYFCPDLTTPILPDNDVFDISEKDIETVGIPKHDWIWTGPRSLTIRTEGYLKNGKRFSGSFLDFKLGVTAPVQVVMVSKYIDGELVETGEPTAYVTQFTAVYPPATTKLSDLLKTSTSNKE